MEQVPQGAPAQEPQAGGDDVMALVQTVGEGLAKLAEKLQAGGSEEDKAQMASILENFSSLVEKKLGGGEPQAMPMDPGAAPMEAGMTGKPMGPQSRM